MSMNPGDVLRWKADGSGFEMASPSTSIETYVTTVAAAGTLTLTASSVRLQYITGTLTHIVVMPVVSTLTLGQRFIITNSGTGAVTINSSGGNLIGTIAGGTYAVLTCILITGTTAASWDVIYQGGIVSPGKKFSIINTLTLSGTDGSTLNIGTGGTLGSNAYTSTSYAPIASPTFTGTVGGITSSMVGLGSVDNTSDAGKPVSTAQQTALNLKANLASPTFTGTVTLPASTALVTPVLGTPTSGTLTNCTFPTLNQNTTGSAAKWTTARLLNGTSVDGSADATITAAAGTLTGATLNATVLASSLTSVGTLTFLIIAAGAAGVTPLKFTSGTLNTSAVAGAHEYDGVGTYITNETSSGRGFIPVEQRFRLTAAGATISTIANYFGSTSNISLVSGGEYEIEIECYFLKTTAGTVTWTFTNSAAPTSMNVHYELSAVGGIVTTAAASTLIGDQYNVTTAAPTVVTGSLTTAVNHRAFFKIRLINSTGTSLKIQATCSAGTITPGINSYWKARRIPLSNIGTFAA